MNRNLVKKYQKNNLQKYKLEKKLQKKRQNHKNHKRKKIKINKCKAHQNIVALQNLMMMTVYQKIKLFNNRAQILAVAKLYQNHSNI